MKKTVLFIAAALMLVSQATAQTHPGRSNLSASITDLGEEFGYGEMISTMTMFMFNVQANFDRNREDVDNGNEQEEGPDNIAYGVTLVPEIRFYSRPDNRVSPFFGVFGLFGYRGAISEFTQAETEVETSTTDLKAGCGFSIGAEFFVNEYLSLSLDSRLLRYQYRKISTEKDFGDATVEETSAGHHVSLRIEPAIYVRLYF